MSTESVRYVIYIRAAPDDVWRGLTEPELTRHYWMHDNLSDWKVGSTWKQVASDGSGGVVVGGEVVASHRPRELALTWALPDDESGAPSTVSFEIEPVESWPHGPWSSVTLVHSGLEVGSEMLESVSFGWPALMSGLKTLLESPRIFGLED